MPYQSPADFRDEYAEAHSRDKTDGFGSTSTLEAVTVVSETPDTARVEARWYTSGHAPDAGYYDVVERTVFVLVKRSDGWHLHAKEDLPYE
jgi:hypothetical protein